MTADLELKQNNVTKARSTIEKARLRNPQNPELWKKAILIEWEHGNKDQVPFSVGEQLSLSSVNCCLTFVA
jgi:hypothetical protein